jgi:hypothetical protein
MCTDAVPDGAVHRRARGAACLVGGAELDLRLIELAASREDLGQVDEKLRPFLLHGGRVGRVARLQRLPVAVFGVLPAPDAQVGVAQTGARDHLLARFAGVPGEVRTAAIARLRLGDLTGRDQQPPHSAQRYDLRTPVVQRQRRLVSCPEESKSGGVAPVFFALAARRDQSLRRVVGCAVDRRGQDFADGIEDLVDLLSGLGGGLA